MTDQATEFAFSPVGTGHDIVPRGAGSQALCSLFSKVRRLMCNLPAPHLALARDCASLIRRQTTSRDLGRNIVCVVAPCFASYLFSILPVGLQPVVTYIWASTVVSNFVYPLGLDCKPRPVAQVTVVDALGNSLAFPWDACESITTFHEQYLKRSRNKPGFMFVKTKNYDVRYDGYILQQTDWKTIQPFTELYVDFVIIQREGTGVMCPWCKTVHSEGPSGDICTCSHCGRDFSVMNSLSSGSGNVAPVDDLRTREVLQRSLSEEILRVRVKFQLPGRMPMGPMHSSDSSPNAFSSDSVSPMVLSANFSQSSLNEPFTTPVTAGTTSNTYENELLQPTTPPTTPKSCILTDDEEPEDDADSRHHDAQAIDIVDHEESLPSVSGDNAEGRRISPAVDLYAQTSQTPSESASDQIHQVHMSNQDQSIYVSPTPNKRNSSQAGIVVFGKTGAGKSSLINLLAGKEIAKVSSQAAGCTSSIQEYTIQSDAGDMYTILDTPGLNEGEAGNVSDQGAFKQLYNLVKRSGSGINLIVYCIRGSRLTDIARVNYDLFYGIICEGKVPIVLVVTGLELGNEMDQWWNQNVKLIERMGMTFDGYACVTTTKGSGGIYEDKFRVSQDRVWALMKEHGNRACRTPGEKWFAEVPQRMDAYMKEYSSRTGQERKLLPMVDRHARRQRTSSTFDTSKSPIKHNIIIFGESGSGKSSLVNMIIGQDVAKVSSGPVGCTFESESYETRIDGIPYNIYDTVGLNEGEEGRVPHWKAIQGLYTLIRKLDGVSLLIFCIRGRIKDNAHANWLFFFDAICDKKVPVIVVSTCWEHEENLQAAETQVWNALKKYSMIPKEVACVVSIWGRNNEYEEKYQLSQQRLRALTVQCRLQEPWCKDKDEWFAQLYQKTFDLKLCLFAKSRLQFVERIRGPLEVFKKGGNLKANDMDTLTKNLLQAEKRILKKRF